MLTYRNNFLKCRRLFFTKSYEKNSSKSSLLISGKRAENTFISVVPHLEFDKRFSKLDQLKQNIKKRKLNLNVEDMQEAWIFFKDWNQKKITLQENLNSMVKQINDMKNNENMRKELNNLERKRNLLKDELQNIKENVWDMEDNVICELLKLPNELHSEVPEEDITLTGFYKENVEHNCNHLSAGTKLDYIEYQNQLSCYLKNDAALFELASQEFFMNEFLNKGFTQFSNPDFARSVLTEGVGLVPNDIEESFLLENTESNNDLLHLCGGSSIFPFCGFLAKHSVRKDSLPFKFVASGRCYTPKTSSSLPGLYSLSQSSSVNFFVASHSEELVYNELQSITKLMTDIISKLGLNYEVVKQSAPCLKNWECLRISFQVMSPFHKEFVEVGNVSIINDYISKRLRMCYSEKSEEKFLKVVSGTAINVQSLLALCLERSKSRIFIPDIIKEYMK